MSEEFYEVTPDPARITESLRDTGYVLNTAVADIIDNSIAAEADTVHIQLAQDIRGNVLFSVADNGHGMTGEGLVNALRYGSAHREDPASLGKFGLGLKTASTAFARRIRLTSRTATSEDILTAVWDLDRVAELGWRVPLGNSPIPADRKLLDSVSNGGPGTVVRWETVDRVIREYKEPGGQRAKNALKKAAQQLRDHLAMVFQRFLDHSDHRAPNVTMVLNGEPIQAWNPFGFGAELLLNLDTPVDTGNGDANLTVRAFVLPRKAEMQAQLGEGSYAESRSGNKTQGIYVYRENRLIHGPDWLGMWVQEPHFTLCRVELSFDHRLDLAFQIDIKKSQIVLDSGLTEFLQQALTPPRREAEIRYRAGQRKVVEAASDKTMHNPSNAAIEEKSQSIPKPELKSTDKTTGKAEIRNPHGIVKVDFVESENQRIFLETVEQLDDGLLYKPSYIGPNPGVLISRSHPYYEKVYLPNRASGVTVQALDSLLWALAAAEFRSAQESTREVFEDIRYDVSKALRKLVEDLPSPELDN
ncbi:ATP-binding protein [Arthrobacter mobilis]|uniref:ATP-binding protein n=1 Tax=Arthrobacter mobilis TaxID=2724944 RepID=A0A7X6HCC1_9MICC|nr:ATP-binding protein [Arthrobacter mobilis]NKX54376.1 ATP-binding protein [Arthrobacter mobilis]